MPDAPNLIKPKFSEGPTRGRARGETSTNVNTWQALSAGELFRRQTEHSA